MKKFDVGLVTVTCAGRTARYTEEQSDGSTKEAIATLAELETPDGFKGTLGVLEWEDGTGEIKLVDFANGPENYRRLESAGRTQIISQGDKWVAIIRALKYGEKLRFNLHNVTLEELSRLIREDAGEFLEKIPNTVITRYGDLQPKATAQHREAIGISVPKGEIEALAAMYAMTRVMPLMMNFGIETVIGMD